MDANHAMRELCSILGVGDFMNPPAIEGCVAAARRLAEELAEAHSRLDDAGIAKRVPIPVRVGILLKHVRRAQDGWAQANSRLDQSNEEVVAARGDLRVERERAEMLEKERDAANQELSETRQALGGFLGPDYRISEEVKKVVAERKMLAERVNELDPTPDVPDPDKRTLPFTEDDRSALTAALVEANRNTKKWRDRAYAWRDAANKARDTLINAYNAVSRGLDFSEPEDWGA